MTQQSNTSLPQRNDAVGDTKSDRDIFTDPALLENGAVNSDARDPVAEFIKRQWKPVLIAVVVAFSVVYVRDAWNASRQATLAASADSFFKVQRALSEYKDARKKNDELIAQELPTDADKKSEAEKKRGEALNDVNAKAERLKNALLVLGDAEEPYRGLQPLMKMIAAKEQGDRTSLSDFRSLFSLAQIRQAAPEKRLTTELGALILARALVDGEETFNEGVALLEELANEGQFVAASAVLTWSRIAPNEESKGRAESAIKSLKERFPEQAALLKDEG